MSDKESENGCAGCVVVIFLILGFPALMLVVASTIAYVDARLTALERSAGLQTPTFHYLTPWSDPDPYKESKP